MRRALHATALAAVLLSPPGGIRAEKPFEIRAVDEATGRGVPLAEFRTVDHLLFVTDSAGRVAVADAALMGRDVWFHVHSHGYEVAKDGFGMTGVRLTPRNDASAVIRLKRNNIAERLYRITGEGLYADSLALGHAAPLGEPLRPGGVAGQDSAQAVVFGGRIRWFWGDTTFLRYPLGNFRVTGATSELPGKGGLNPAEGINLSYDAGPDGHPRPLCPLPEQEGAVWIDGVSVVPDAAGRERLVAHYSRVRKLGDELDQGIVVWREKDSVFERATRLPLADRWRFPSGHPIRRAADGSEWLQGGTVFPTVRVPARYEAVTNPALYEVWTCIEPDTDAPRRRADGSLDYGWRRDARPVSGKDEARWLKAGLIGPEETRYLPADIEGGGRVILHGGSVRWNEHRRRWVLIAVQEGGTSFLGEVWYAEADDPLGPWPRARKIVTHERYSFYNPVHHDFLDDDGGRLIFFEGTYANTFSGNSEATPRYDYNQVMYRLDLDDPRLAGVR